MTAKLEVDSRNWIPRRWADPLPFTYETTGVETNFRDQRDPDSRSRPVFGFHTPGHLLDFVQQPDSLRARLRQFPIPIPPIDEQHQIVAEVEARTTAIDHLKAELDRQITRSNRLRQSTLASAFQGEL